MNVLYVFLLSKYVSSLSYYSLDEAVKIMEDDQAFAVAIQKYKNIVTHYLSSKFEIWMAHFMKPVFGVNGGLAGNEFAISRGALHYHSLLQCDNNNENYDLYSSLSDYSLHIHDSLSKLNTFISNTYNQEIHGDLFPTSPASDVLYWYE